MMIAKISLHLVAWVVAKFGRGYQICKKEKKNEHQVSGVSFETSKVNMYKEISYFFGGLGMGLG